MDKVIFNLSEIDVILVDQYGNITHRFRKSDHPLCFKGTDKTEGDVDGILIKKEKDTGTLNLPKQTGDILYIVDREDAYRLQRSDLCWVSDEYWDNDGNRVGFQSLTHI